MFRKAESLVSGKVSCVGFALLVCCAFGPEGVQAQSLGLKPPDPVVADISSFQITVNYDASNGSLSALGTPTSLNSEFQLITPPSSFDIQMTLDPATGKFETGSLAISGQIAGLGYTTAGGDLLDGKLTAFGYSPGAGSALEFIFTVTGGQMNTPEWYPSQVGVVLSDASFPGNFTHSFSNDALGMADSFAYPTADNAPEPSSMVTGVVLTVLSGLAYLVRSRFVSKVKPA